VIKLFKIVWNWLDDRLGISVLLSPMKHIAPQAVDHRTDRPS